MTASAPTPTSRVVLQGLEFHAHHGVYTPEATLGARFVVDAELHYPFVDLSDELGEAVNYAEVYAAIAAEVTETRRQLIEVLAHRIARRVLSAQPKLLAITVRVHKPFAPLPGVFRDVYAELTLTRAEV
ncbi:dihydroneopterin aldolase [Deinococcus sp. HMF7620]|uniref:7,8-dihydroneopterin aldolase n=1 Tax=Deinococcus arboris TaxID=2682977 RepID=A0A7C9HST6_9DEIO|nr:dihydroneopterin aldolase [Deinococcus arboris]MVN88092.1 dihydroneopterin aldolase [Deinococcus arboris]